MKFKILRRGQAVHSLANPEKVFQSYASPEYSSAFITYHINLPPLFWIQSSIIKLLSFRYFLNFFNQFYHSPTQTSILQFAVHFNWKLCKNWSKFLIKSFVGILIEKKIPGKCICPSITRKLMLIFNWSPRNEENCEEIVTWFSDKTKSSENVKCQAKGNQSILNKSQTYRKT